MRACAALAGPNSKCCVPGRAEKIQPAEAGSSILKGSGPDSIKGSIKNFKIFSFFKISYLIINKSHIFNNVHNLSLIFNKFVFKIQKL